MFMRFKAEVVKKITFMVQSLKRGHVLLNHAGCWSLKGSACCIRLLQHNARAHFILYLC